MYNGSSFKGPWRKLRQRGERSFPASGSLGTLHARKVRPLYWDGCKTKQASGQVRIERNDVLIVYCTGKGYVGLPGMWAALLPVQ